MKSLWNTKKNINGCGQLFLLNSLLVAYKFTKNAPRAALRNTCFITDTLLKSLIRFQNSFKNNLKDVICWMWPDLIIQKILFNDACKVKYLNELTPVINLQLLQHTFPQINKSLSKAARHLLRSFVDKTAQMGYRF